MESSRGPGSLSREYKLVMLGEGGVGKSAIIMQFISHRFPEDHDPTIGGKLIIKALRSGEGSCFCLYVMCMAVPSEDAYKTQIRIDDEPANLDILDTAGQAEFTAMRDQYMRAGEGFIISYSITDRRSFQEARHFKQLIYRVRRTVDTPVVLVGNKSDLAHLRQWKHKVGVSNKVTSEGKHKVGVSDKVARGGKHKVGVSDKVASEGKHKVCVSNKVTSEGKHKVGVSDKVARGGKHKVGVSDKVARGGKHKVGVSDKVARGGKHKVGVSDKVARGGKHKVGVSDKVARGGKHKVSIEEGKELAREFQCPFFETSAAFRYYIDEVFAALVRQIRQKEAEVVRGNERKSRRSQSFWSRLKAPFHRKQQSEH
ncbi:hypothetical protein NFI96_030484 [Prochilodus magdalenae]|nr:hypothetical protein NFI96_030484 [Prochilodus magdalenae]